jgi:hypothetical protein
LVSVIISVLGSRNYYKGVEQTSRFRSINREKLCRETLENELSENGSRRNIIFNKYKDLIKIRKRQKAFHPNASQKVIFANDSVFSLTRKAIDDSETILVLINVSGKVQKLTIDLSEYELTDSFVDLISGTNISSLNNNLQICIEPFQVMWLKCMYTQAEPFLGFFSKSRFCFFV